MSIWWILDILLEMLHLAVIAFNLLGWIFPCSRLIHRYVLGLTAASWIGLGWFYGIGYCFLTDWHWYVKAHMGVTGLPHSYMTYLLIRVFGWAPSDRIVDAGVVVGFAVALIGAIVVYLMDRRVQKSSTNNSG